MAAAKWVNIHLSASQDTQSEKEQWRWATQATQAVLWAFIFHSLINTVTLARPDDAVLGIQLVVFVRAGDTQSVSTMTSYFSISQIVGSAKPAVSSHNNP